MFKQDHFDSLDVRFTMSEYLSYTLQRAITLDEI